MSYWIYKQNGYCSSDMINFVLFFSGSSPEARSTTRSAPSMSTPPSTVQTVQVDVHRSVDDDDDEEYDDVLRDEGKDREDLPSVACEGRFQMKIDLDQAKQYS